MRAAAAAIAAVGFGLLAAGCGDSKKASPSPPNQASTTIGGTANQSPAPISVLDALPVGVEVVAGARIADLAKQELVTRAVGLMFARDPELETRLSSLLDGCKIDPARDVESVVLGLGKTRDQVLMVVSGRLVEPEIARCTSQGMVALGGSIEIVAGPSGHTIYHATGAHDVYFAFLASGTIAISSGQAWLEQALGSGDKVAAHPLLGPLLGRAHRDAGLWVIGVVPEGVGRALVEAVHGELAAPPIAFTGYLLLDGGLEAELGLVMEHADDANTAASKAIPQLALSSLVVQQFSLGSVVNKLRVVVEDAVLYLRISLTETEVDETLARLDLIGSPTEVDSEGGPQQDTPVRNQ